MSFVCALAAAVVWFVVYSGVVLTTAGGSPKALLAEGRKEKVFFLAAVFLGHWMLFSVLFASPPEYAEVKASVTQAVKPPKGADRAQFARFRNVAFQKAPPRRSVPRDFTPPDLASRLAVYRRAKTADSLYFRRVEFEPMGRVELLPPITAGVRVLLDTTPHGPSYRNLTRRAPLGEIRPGAGDAPGGDPGGGGSGDSSDPDDFDGDGVARAARPSRLVPAQLVPAQLAPIQDDPMAPDPGDGESQPDDLDKPLPSTEVRVSLAPEYAIDGKTALAGELVEIGGQTGESIAIRRVPFEGDPNFETATYTVAAAKKAYDALAPSGQFTIKVRRGGGFTTHVLQKGWVVDLVWPATLVDLFERAMVDCATGGVEAHLIGLQSWREQYASEIGEFSERMQLAFEAAVLRQFDLLRDTDPTYVPLYLDLGDFLNGLGRYDAELAVYMRALNRGIPGATEPMAVRLARLYLRVLDLPEKALDVLDNAGALIEGQLLRAEALLRLKREREAESVARKAAQLVTALLADEDYETLDAALPDLSAEEAEAEARRLWGEAALKLGALDVAEAVLGSVAEGGQTFRVARVRYAETLYHQGRASSMPDYDDVRDILSQNNDQLPIVKQAIRDSRRESDPVGDPSVDVYADDTTEVAYDPLVAEALCLLARALIADAARRKNATPRDTVGKYAHRAMRFDPTSDEPFLVLFAYARARPEPQIRATATAWLDRALAVNPKNPLTYYLRALTHARAGEFTKATADIDRALARAADFADALVLRGEIAYARSRIAPLVLVPGARSSGVDRETLLSRAAQTFASALDLAPEYPALNLKLAGVLTEQAVIAERRAAYLIGRKELDRGRLNLDEQIDRASSACLKAIQGAEQKYTAADQAARLEGARRPVVLEHVVAPDGSSRRVLVSVGQQEGVRRGLRLEIVDTPLARGGGVVLEVIRAFAHVSEAAPIAGYSRPEDLARVQAISPGDPVGRPHRIVGSGGERLAVVLDWDQAMRARTGLAYLAFLRDTLEGQQASRRGERYAPTRALSDAKLRFAQVIAFGDQKSSIGRQFQKTETYQYARACHDLLARREALVQWVDEFDDRTIPPGNHPDQVARGWMLNLARDMGVEYSVSQAGSGTLSGRGTLGGNSFSTLTRSEDVRLLAAIAAEFLVDPSSTRPPDRRPPAGLDTARLGLIVDFIPANQQDPTGTPKPSARLLVAFAPDGTVVYRTGAKLGATGEATLGNEKPVPWPPSPSDAVPGRVRSLRLERQSAPNNRVRWVVVADGRRAILPDVPDVLTRMAGGGSEDYFRLGLVLSGSAGARVDFKVEAVRIVRETEARR